MVSPAIREDRDGWVSTQARSRR